MDDEKTGSGEGESNKDFVFSFGGQKEDETSGYGACCDVRGRQSDGLTVARNQLGAFKLTVASGVLTLAKDSTIVLFEKGVGQTAAGAGLVGNFTKADTDAFSEGALAIDGFNFLVKSLGFQLEEPWMFDTDGKRPNVIELAAYREAIMRALARDVSVSVTAGENTSSYELGPLGMYPSHVGPVSQGSFAQIGAPFTGAVNPLAAALKSGGKSGSNKMKITLTVHRDIVIGTRGDDAVSAAVMAPVRALVVGHPVRAHGAAPGSGAPRSDIERRFDRLERIVERLAEAKG